jgi:hypothetical protein
MISSAVRRRFVALPLALSVAGLVWGGQARASQNLIVTCGSTGQVCANAAAFTVTAQRGLPVFVRLQTPSRHCSDVSYAVWPAFGGTPKRTQFLKTNESEVINLGTLVPGQHAFLITATGRSGGCNSGTLASWGVIVNP